MTTNRSARVVRRGSFALRNSCALVLCSLSACASAQSDDRSERLEPRAAASGETVANGTTSSTPSAPAATIGPSAPSAATAAPTAECTTGGAVATVRARLRRADDPPDHPVALTEIEVKGPHADALRLCRALVLGALSARTDPRQAVARACDADPLPPDDVALRIESSHDLPGSDDIDFPPDDACGPMPATCSGAVRDRWGRYTSKAECEKDRVELDRRERAAYEKELARLQEASQRAARTFAACKAKAASSCEGAERDAKLTELVVVTLREKLGTMHHECR